jgi:hypothetical protein
MWHSPKPPPNSDIPHSEILYLHRMLGHAGTHALFSWATFRNIPITWHQCKVAISKCPDCPQTITRFKFHPPISSYKRDSFNYLSQIDFTGPLKTHKDYYACAIVDIYMGLLLAKAHNTPNQIVTIYTLWCWIARYGMPIIIKSD